MENMHDDEVEIDLGELFFALKKKIVLILASGLLFGCLACGYTIFFMTPTYTSTSSMLAISKETTLTSIADLQLGTQLTKDYQILITSTPVLDKVIKNLGLDMEAKELRKSITITNPADTRILEISVVHTEPEMAKKIVDEVTQTASGYIGDKMEVIPPKIIEEGQIPVYKTGPSIKKNAMLGLLAGFALAGGLVIVLTILNDSIKSEEDITKYLGIPTLASIPDRKDYINISEKKRKAKKKKKNSSRRGKK